MPWPVIASKWALVGWAGSVFGRNAVRLRWTATAVLLVASAITLALFESASSRSQTAAEHRHLSSVASLDGTSSASSDPVTSPSASVTTGSTAPTPPARSHPSRPTGTAVPAVVTDLAAGGIPVVALNAYRRAGARLASAEPGCGVPWYLVAAIGRVESDHGRFGGASLYANGDSRPRIIGIPLDGSRSARITDTDGGRLDGDKTYDRAVGPMQFIPSTWARYAVDGNGDGTADPFNIDDAALATAHYLCVAGGNLRVQAGVITAILAYNHSDAYLKTVYSLAQVYARDVEATGPITGPVSGPLPPPSGSGPPPPVDPGVPPVLASPHPKPHPTAPHPTSSHPKSTATSRPTAPATTGSTRSGAPTTSPSSDPSTTVPAPSDAPTDGAGTTTATTQDSPCPILLGLC